MEEIAAYEDGIYYDNFLILTTIQEEDEKSKSEVE